MSKDRLFNTALKLTVISFPFDLCQADSGFIFKYLGAGIRRHWRINYPPGLHYGANSTFYLLCQHERLVFA